MYKADATFSTKSWDHLCWGYFPLYLSSNLRHFFILFLSKLEVIFLGHFWHAPLCYQVGKFPVSHEMVSSLTTLWCSLSEKKIQDKNLSPLHLRQFFYFEGTFPVYFEGLLRALFSSIISRNLLKCNRGRDEVTVTAGIGHIKGTCM